MKELIKTEAFKVGKYLRNERSRTKGCSLKVSNYASKDSKQDGSRNEES